MNHKSLESTDLFGVCEPVVFGLKIQLEVHVSVRKVITAIWFFCHNKTQLDLENNATNGTNEMGFEANDVHCQ